MRSRWTTTIGILGIIFGSFGVLSAGQVMFLPTMLNLERQMFSRMSEDPNQPFAGAMKGMFESFLAPTPPWFTSWCIGLGVVALVVSGLYVFSGIWLVISKPNAARQFCIVLVASIAVSVLRLAGMMVATGALGMAMGLGGSFGVVIDVVLLAVVLAYRREWHLVGMPAPPVVGEVKP